MEVFASTPDTTAWVTLLLLAGTRRTPAKSADFFDVERFPNATFQSSKIVAVKAKGATHRITGVLKLHGVSKEVGFTAAVSTDGKTLKASTEFEINRFDWKIEYKGMADNLIKKEVVLKINFEIPVS